MKKKLVTIISVIVAGVFFLGITSAFTPFQNKPWNVPDAAKNKKNPVANAADAISAGKALWSTHCKSCHGTKGLGDGSKAAQLKTEPGDFSKGSFQSQTDGALFYKTSEGRDDMPSFKKKIADADDIWSLVHYMRTLKK
jgi:mono/diheme cytochrome c family protein